MQFLLIAAISCIPGYNGIFVVFPTQSSAGFPNISLSLNWYCVSCQIFLYRNNFLISNNFFDFY
jgi:hypothetical protein